MRRLVLLASALAVSTGLGCRRGGPTDVPSRLTGVFVVYNLGCEVGCDQIDKGDIIQRMDDAEVEAVEDLYTLADGRPHRLDLRAWHTWVRKSVDVTATPKHDMPPLVDVPPCWLVSAEEMQKAPTWARRRMFGHASPMVMLVDGNGGILDGRQLFGRRRLIVYWDHGDRVEEAAAVDFMQVLQKARDDLHGGGVEILFVHVRFPSGRKTPMNDTDLRAWQRRWAVAENGRRLDPLPFYRFPNDTEFDAARELGMENAYTVFENLGSSPTIVMLDENGIVRWHSEGVQDPQVTGNEVLDPEQSTIIAAVMFALEDL